MKKKILLIGASALLLCGCGKIPTLSNGDEAVVKFNDGHMISVNDLYEQVKNTYGLNSLVTLVDTYIYETELPKEKIESADSYAKMAIKQLQDSYSSESDMLTYISYFGYNSLDAYQKGLYLSYLQNTAIEEYVKSQITEKELKDYYENSVYPNMTISHILVKAETSDTATDDEKTEAEDKAKETINTIIKELDKAKKAKEDVAAKFSELAKKYSQDDGTKNDGGSLGEINLGSLNNQYDELVEAAAKLKDGEYSTELITTEAGYHVILKTKTGEKKSYDEALEEMNEAIVEDKLSSEDSNSYAVDALQYYRKKYDLDIIDSELKSQYGNYMNNLINSARNNN